MNSALFYLRLYVMLVINIMLLDAAFECLLIPCKAPQHPLSFKQKSTNVESTISKNRVLKSDKTVKIYCIIV